MNNEALEALKSAVAKAKTMGLKGQDCVPAYIAEVCEAADTYIEALTPEVDLAELEQKICDYLSYTKYHKSEKHAVKYALVYLAERGLLRGDVAGQWETISSCPLGKKAMFYHRAWRSPFPGTLNGDDGAVMVDYGDDGWQTVATHWREIDTPETIKAARGE